jgi:hypothetical protein
VVLHRASPARDRKARGGTLVVPLAAPATAGLAVTGTF